MRPVLAYMIVTVLVILLHILRLNNTNKYLPKQEAVINGFVLMQYSPTCWYVHEQLLFKLTECRQYELGTTLNLIGTVTTQSDNLPTDLSLLAVSEVKAVVRPFELPWYHPNLIQSNFFQIREMLQQRLVLVFPKTEAVLLFSVLFGGISYLPEELKEAISYLGIQHIMAASGMQVVLLLFVFSPLLKRCSRTMAFLLQLMLLSLYAQLALMSVSILRAILQSGTSLLLITFKKQQVAGWILVLTSLILFATISIDSQLAFQLSFLAIIGLQFRFFLERSLLSRRKSSQEPQSLLKQIITYIKEVLITTIYVQIWLFPFLCHYFGQVSGMSVISTLAIVWLLTPLFLIGIPTVGLLSLVPFGFVQSPVVLWLCWPLHNLLWVLNQLIQLMALVPVPPIVVVFPTPLLLAWYFVLLTVFWWFDSRWRKQLYQCDLKTIRKKY